MDLYHATDLHITWGYTCHNMRVNVGFGSVPLFPFGGLAETHTRLTAEAIVAYFAKMLKRGKRDWHLVLTGDLTDTGSIEEMEMARAILKPIWDPELLSVTPGNHDCAAEIVAAYARGFKMEVPWKFEARRKAFRRIFKDLLQPSLGFGSDWPCVKILERQQLALVLLDSTKFESTYATGRIFDWQLAGLDNALQRITTHRTWGNWPILVALHHSPLEDGQTMRLIDADRLMETCATRVTAVINGHLHYFKVARDRTHRGLRVLQADTSAIPEDRQPQLDFNSIPVSRYRLHGRDLQPASDIDRIDVPLAPAVHSRHALFRGLYAPLFRKTIPCDRCGGPVAPEMICCPWCAAETDFTAHFTTVCSSCSQPVMQGYDYCPWCGVRRAESTGRYETDRMSARCQKCESGVEPYHWYCPACHAKLEEPEDNHPEPCSQCGWPTDPNVYLYCPWCGDPQ